MTMLEYFKVILEKVSFDPTLFKTEFRKAAHKLMDEDLNELKKWCIDTFGLNYCQQADPSFGI